MVRKIGPAIAATRRPGADPSLGGFGGLFDLAAAGFKDPVLVAATDGVWETVDPEGAFFGKDRLRDVIRANADRSADDIARSIIQATHDFRGHDHPADDVTVVVVRHGRSAPEG